MLKKLAALKLVNTYEISLLFYYLRFIYTCLIYTKRNKSENWIKYRRIQIHLKSQDIQNSFQRKDNI